MEPGTQKDYYNIEMCSKEQLDNNLTRVVKRYDGNISDGFSSLMISTVLKTFLNASVKSPMCWC